MGNPPDNHELARQLAVLEERMKTMQADLSAALERNNAAFDRLRADMTGLEKRLVEKNAETADRIATATERMANSRWWQTAIMIAVVALVGAAVAGIPTLPAIIEAIQR